MVNKIIEIGYGNVKKVKVGGHEPLVFIGGPCAIESESHALMMADKISEICENLQISQISLTNVKFHTLV